MAISRKDLIDELCELSDHDLEKLLEKHDSSNVGFRLGVGAGGGAAVGAVLGGPIGAGVGAFVGTIYGQIVGSSADSKSAKQVREAVANKDKLKLPDGFCIWAEEEKKKGEWLKFDKPSQKTQTKTSQTAYGKDPIVFACPNCNTELTARPYMATEETSCKHCKKPVTVPDK